LSKVDELKIIVKSKLAEWYVLGQREDLVCDVCGSDDVIEAPSMGRNCNSCHPL
jgi:hypothetical protein